MATSQWIALFGLGAFHGLNPGMGWLFAVALGLQEGRRAAVWEAMLPIGLGHALAVAAAVIVATALGGFVPLTTLRWGIGSLLLALGAWRLVRHRHPRAGGMRVGKAGLTLWSFLMASAHGAGLMVLPVVVAGPADGHAAHADIVAGAGSLTIVLATALHGAGYLLAAGLAAWLVVDRFGVIVLRRAWWNVDRLWAMALVVTGLVCLLL